MTSTSSPSRFARFPVAKLSSTRTSSPRVEQAADEVRTDEPAAAGDEDAAHRLVAVTWKFAKSAPGTGARRSATRLSSAAAAGVQTRDQRARRGSEMSSLEHQVHELGEEEPEAGGGARARAHGHVGPVSIRGEQPLEPGVRPAPVIDGIGVVHHHAVCRGKHAPARRRRRGAAREPRAAGRRRARAPAWQDDVEAPVFDWQRLDRAV